MATFRKSTFVEIFSFIKGFAVCDRSDKRLLIVFTIVCGYMRDDHWAICKADTCLWWGPQLSRMSPCVRIVSRVIPISFLFWINHFWFEQFQNQFLRLEGTTFLSVYRLSVGFEGLTENKSLFATEKNKIDSIWFGL